jgi:hypothetical protein
MTDADQTTFAHLMAMLDKAFRQETSEMGNEVYWQGLRDCEIEDVKAAFVKAIRDLKFYPKVAELRGYIIGEADDMAALAWREVNKAIGMPGTYVSVMFGDPVIHWVVEQMGGWPAMGLITKDDAPFREQDFRRLYSVGLKRGIGWADVSGYLKGRFAMDDAMKPVGAGHEVKQIECDYLTAQRRAEIEAGRKRELPPGASA